MKVRATLVLAAVTAVLSLSASADAAPFTAYADTVPAPVTGTVPAVQVNAANTALLSIGANSSEGYTWTGPTSAALKDHTTGAETGVTATLTQNGGVVYQPAASTGGGASTAVGTDAYNAFNGIVDMTGVVFYSNTAGWYVDLAFTGLDPAMEYTFVTSADRNGSGYDSRVTRYTLSGVESATNASSTGTIVDNATTAFSTGSNFAAGNIAMWTGIMPGPDGSFSVRAQAHSDNRAYTFDAFMLQGAVVPEPTSLALLGLGAMALLRRRNG